MLPFHILLYLSIIIVASFAELSIKVNTDSVGKKAGLCIIIVGAMMEVANVHNPFVPLGTLIYFSQNVLVAYFNHKKRRASDGQRTTN